MTLPNIILFGGHFKKRDEQRRDRILTNDQVTHQPWLTIELDFLDMIEYPRIESYTDIQSELLDYLHFQIQIILCFLHNECMEICSLSNKISNLSLLL